MSRSTEDGEQHPLLSTLGATLQIAILREGGARGGARGVSPLMLFINLDDSSDVLRGEGGERVREEGGEGVIESKRGEL